MNTPKTSGSRTYYYGIIIEQEINRISKESVFTGLNNFASYSIMQERYSQYFGFTETEVKEMVEYYQLGGIGLFDKLKEWYDGYQFGKTEIYNPWSILQVMKAHIDNKDAFPLPYWSNTSSNEIVRHLIDKADITVVQTVEALLRGETIRKKISEDITYGDMDKYKDSLWNFLYNTGYLTAERIEYQDGNIFAELRIPNKEVRYIFENHIQLWMEDVIEESNRDVLYSAIINQDAAVVESELNDFLIRTISYNDYRESFYHGLLTGILSGLKNYAIKSNRENGLGRSDIVATHASGSGKAIIFEFKYSADGPEMRQKSQEALEQIETMKYDAELKAEGYDDIIK